MGGKWGCRRHYENWNSVKMLKTTTAQEAEHKRFKGRVQRSWHGWGVSPGKMAKMPQRAGRHSVGISNGSHREKQIPRKKEHLSLSGKLLSGGVSLLENRV